MDHKRTEPEYVYTGQKYPYDEATNGLYNNAKAFVEYEKQLRYSSNGLFSEIKNNLGDEEKEIFDSLKEYMLNLTSKAKTNGALSLLFATGNGYCIDMKKFATDYNNLKRNGDEKGIKTLCNKFNKALQYCYENNVAILEYIYDNKNKLPSGMEDVRKALHQNGSGSHAAMESMASIRNNHIDWLKQKASYNTLSKND